MPLPSGASVKWILLPTILNAPLKILASEPSLCDVAEVPTNPLDTLINGTVPIPLIGPDVVVPNPTFWISRNSSSTLRISLGLIEEIPESDMKETAAPIVVPPLFSKLNVNGVYANGYWVTPSIVISAFSSFFFISSLWRFPVPTSVNVNPIPLPPAVPVNLNVSLESLIAYTLEGILSVVIPVVNTSLIVDAVETFDMVTDQFGLSTKYVLSSPPTIDVDAVIELIPIAMTVPNEVLSPEKIPEPTLITDVLPIPVITVAPALTTSPWKYELNVWIPVIVVFAAIPSPNSRAPEVKPVEFAIPVIVEKPVSTISPVNKVPLTTVVPIPTEVAAMPINVDVGV